MRSSPGLEFPFFESPYTPGSVQECSLQANLQKSNSRDDSVETGSEDLLQGHPGVRTAAPSFSLFGSSVPGNALDNVLENALEKIS
jgi:hypothetical protein